MDYMDSKCRKHDTGHCWHETGPTAYKGRYLSTVSVICCHCRRTGKRTRHSNGGLELDDEKVQP